MRIFLVFTVPLGFVVLLLGGLPAALNLEGPPPRPENIDLFTEADYQNKAEAYAQLDRRQEALDTCAEITEKFDDSESAHGICLLDVYEVLGDIDGEIEVYEAMLARNLVNGDTASAASTQQRIESLREERAKKR